MAAFRDSWPVLHHTSLLVITSGQCTLRPSWDTVDVIFTPHVSEPHNTDTFITLAFKIVILVAMCTSLVLQTGLSNANISSSYYVLICSSAFSHHATEKCQLFNLQYTGDPDVVGGIDPHHFGFTRVDLEACSSCMKWLPVSICSYWHPGASSITCRCLRQSQGPLVSESSTKFL